MSDVIKERARSLHAMVVIVSLAWVSAKHLDRGIEPDGGPLTGAPIQRALDRFREYQGILPDDYGVHLGIDLAAVKVMIEWLNSEERSSFALPELSEIIDPDKMPLNAPIEYEVAMNTALEASARIMMKIRKDNE